MLPRGQKLPPAPVELAAAAPFCPAKSQDFRRFRIWHDLRKGVSGSVSGNGRRGLR